MALIQLGREWSELMAAYELDHQNPVNRACHTVGIPMILASLPLGASVVGLPLAAPLFTVGWAFQFLGTSSRERSRPSSTINEPSSSARCGGARRWGSISSRCDRRSHHRRETPFTGRVAQPREQTTREVWNDCCRSFSRMGKRRVSFAMMRRSAASAIALAITAGTTDASAVGSISGPGHEPIEQRVALALGPQRTVLWTQLRVDALPGALAIVAPASEGARLDWSSDAFFEALELATAPRVLPPRGVTPACPGEIPPTDPVVNTGNPYHQQSLAPLEVFIAQDAAELIGWAELHGMSVSAETAGALAATAGPFVAARFSAPDGEVLTPALRIATDQAIPTLPLVLSESGTEPLRITSFVLAEGRVALDGAVVGVGTSNLSYGLATGTSNYDALRMSALGSQSGSWLLEASSRAGFLGGFPIEDTPHLIPGFVEGYFQRVAFYEGGIDPAVCTSQAAAALAASAPIAQSCARGDLGSVGVALACSESPAPGEIDPSALRCGGDESSTAADDLAVALAGQTASQIWLSRVSIRIDGTGESRAVGTSDALAIDPVLQAGKVDASGCGGSSGSTGSSSSSSSGAGGGDTTSGTGGSRVPVYLVESGCGAREVGTLLYFVDVVDDDPPDAYYREEDSCGGDTSESYAWYEETASGEGETDLASYDEGDDCGGDSSDGYDEGYDDGDDCGGDSSDGYDEGDDCGGDSSDGYDDGDDCGGDSSDGYDEGDDCGGESSDGYEGDDCGGDTSDGYDDDDDSSDYEDGGDGSSSGDDFGKDTGTNGAQRGGRSGGGCSIGGRRVRPRLSPLVLGGLFVIFPLRRLTRPARGEGANGRGRGRRGVPRG
jgi:hypothetical protein